MSQSQLAKQLPFKVVTVSNFFSLLRIIAAPLISYFLIQKLYVRGLVVFVGAALTDAFDGYFARLLDEESSLGVYLDPIADKVLVSTCFITLLLTPPPGVEIPLWFVAFVCVREGITLLAAVVLYVFGMRGIEFSPTIMGKATMIGYLLLLIWLMFAGVLPYLTEFSPGVGLYLIVGMALFSSGEYVIRAVRYIL